MNAVCYINSRRFFGTDIHEAWVCYKSIDGITATLLGPRLGISVDPKNLDDVHRALFEWRRDAEGLFSPIYYTKGMTDGGIIKDATEKLKEPEQREKYLKRLTKEQPNEIWKAVVKAVLEVKEKRSKDVAVQKET